MGAAAENSVSNCGSILQEVLFELLSYGVPPKRYVVSNACVLPYWLCYVSVYDTKHCDHCSLCCAYLAFKVDEYNLTLDQFVHVLAPHLVKPTTEFILSHEVLLPMHATCT